MTIVDTKTKKKYEAFIRIGYNGDQSIKCPVCSDNRKKGNANKKPLSFNAAKGTGMCHNCDAVFVEDNGIEYQPKKEYSKPVWRNKTQLSERVVKWFETERGINQNTLIEAKVSEGIEYMPQKSKEVNTIQFNYFRDDVLINVKYRTADKFFKLHKDAELILYNLDAIKESTECLICEGEIDCLSFMQAGYKFATSVPNGANKLNQNLQYIDNCMQYLENKEKIYISYDNDIPGIALRDELIRRFGAERCYLINLKGEKDANDCLRKMGAQTLIECIETATPAPISGTYTIMDFKDKLDIIYRNGFQSGLKIDLEGFDDLCTFEPGRFCVVTGIPGHGKSEFVDEIVERLNIIHGWKAAYFSPENFPLEYHGIKITEKITGKKFRVDTLNENEYSEASEYIADNFTFIMPPDTEFSLDNILDKARQLIRQKGIRTLVIDPWNRLEYQSEYGETETKYVARQLSKITNFARVNNILVFLIAHPVKIQISKETGYHELPTLYSISGSANFFNMCDYGITVFRDFKEGFSDIHIQKVKFRHLGEIGKVSFKYNINNGRYTSYGGVGDVAWDNRNHLRFRNQMINSIQYDQSPPPISPNLAFDFETPSEPPPF